MTPAELGSVLRGHGALHRAMAAEISSGTVAGLDMLSETQKQSLLAVQLGLAESFESLAETLGTLS